MIFVMAASGEVGLATVKELLRQGVEPGQIAGGGRNTAKMEGLRGMGVQVRKADYGDLKSLESAFEGVETLVLIPTKTEPAPRCQEYDNALKAAKTAGVKRIVFLSIQACTPQSLFSVAPFILFAECATRISGMEWTIARMSLYSDPLFEWAPELAKTGILPYPLVNARIAYVSRADVAKSLAALAWTHQWTGKIVELTGPEALTMPELASAISQAVSSPIRFETIDEDQYRDLCQKENLPEEITEILVAMYRAAEAQEFAKVTGDIASITGDPPESVAAALSRLLKKSTI